MLNDIVTDIENALTIRIKSVSLFGIDIRIFIDVIGFMTHYPAVSSLVDVKSHSADTPCPLCSFTRKTQILGSANG